MSAISQAPVSRIVPLECTADGRSFGEDVKARAPSVTPLVAVLLATALFAVAISLHALKLNGSPYHRWGWRDMPMLWTYPFIVPCAIPFFLAQRVYRRNPGRVTLALGLLMVSTFALMVSSAAAQRKPPGPGPIVGVVISDNFSGYFSQAVELKAAGLTVRQWLAKFPSLLPTFTNHPRIKPPGPILYNTFFVELFGAGKFSALFSGIGIGLLAVLTVPATYAFIRYFSGSRDAAFFGSSYLALCPCLLLIYPQLDQTYALFTVGLTLLWAAALTKNRPALSLAFGLLYAAAILVTYLPAVLVIFLGGFSLWKLATDRAFTLRRILGHAMIAAAGFLGFYVVLWLATQFNPIATFRVCVAMQQKNMQWLEPRGFGRHLPGTILWDLYDFALGSGWISFILLGSSLASRLPRELPSPRLRIALLCIGQFLLVAIAGLIQCETARVWMFMLPMLMLPIGLELARWSDRSRIAAYACLLLLTLVIYRNVAFVT